LRDLTYLNRRTAYDGSNRSSPAILAQARRTIERDPQHSPEEEEEEEDPFIFTFIFSDTEISLRVPGLVRRVGSSGEGVKSGTCSGLGLQSGAVAGNLRAYRASVTS
jgi:hypothetical protein